MVLLLPSYKAYNDLQGGLADRAHVTAHAAVAKGHGFGSGHVFEAGTAVVGLDFLRGTESTAYSMTLEAEVKLLNRTGLATGTEVVHPGRFTTLKAKHMAIMAMLLLGRL